MNVNVHKPTCQGTSTIYQPLCAIQIISIGDQTGSFVDLFISSDWSEWDAIVAKVQAYRDACVDE